MFDCGHWVSFEAVTGKLLFKMSYDFTLSKSKKLNYIIATSSWLTLLEERENIDMTV